MFAFTRLDQNEIEMWETKMLMTNIDVLGKSKLPMEKRINQDRMGLPCDL